MTSAALQKGLHNHSLAERQSLIDETLQANRGHCIQANFDLASSLTIVIKDNLLVLLDNHKPLMHEQHQTGVGKSSTATSE